MKFKYFLQKYKLSSINIHQKYKTRAARYYRDNLDRILSGEDMEEAPSFKEGNKVEVIQSAFTRSGLTGFGSDDLIKPERKEESSLKDKWDQGKKKMTMWGNSIGKSVGGWFKKGERLIRQEEKEVSEERRGLSAHGRYVCFQRSGFQAKVQEPRKSKWTYWNLRAL